MKLPLNKFICLAILVILSSINCKPEPKFKYPKKNVLIEVRDKTVKQELDETSIVDFYPIVGTEIDVRIFKLTFLGM